jgi:endonuclease YncB( thermonuclease family)
MALAATVIPSDPQPVETPQVRGKPVAEQAPEPVLTAPAKPEIVVKEVKVSELLIGTVDRVIDGDSLIIRYDDGKTEEIRVAGIDAPELDQPYGTEAKQLLWDHILGQRVVVTRREKDLYGRRLANLNVPGERGLWALDATLVRFGMAWHYADYDDSQQLSENQLRARMEKLGLWASKNPVPPWAWRNGERTAAASLVETTTSKPTLTNHGYAADGVSARNEQPPTVSPPGQVSSDANRETEDRRAASNGAPHSPGPFGY